MENEIWRPIKGYEGLYEVSNFGRIKSVERIIRSGKGYGCHKYGGKLLKFGGSLGYKRVSLCKERRISTYSVHRLVAEAFIPNPDNKPEIDHINTIRDDNRVSNLRWVTKSENARNQISSSKRIKNKSDGSAKITGKLNKLSKPIVAVNIETGEEIRFDCLKDAYRSGFNIAHVSECINNGRNKYKGYEWYEEKKFNVYKNFCHVFQE
jgi:hypothetical protein